MSNPDAMFGAKRKSEHVVMLATVGNRDPTDAFTGELGPVLQYVDKIQNDTSWLASNPENEVLGRTKFAYLLHTTDKKQNALDVASRLEAVNIATRILDLRTDDPTDFTALLKQMGKCAYEVTSAHPSDRLTVLVSPGTSQMNAVFLTLGNEGRLNARFIQKIEPRHSKKDKVRGDVRPINFKPLFEAEAINTGVKLLRRYDFAGASQAFEQLEHSVNDHRRSISPFLAGLCRVYAHWDLFDYEKARQSLHDLFRYEIKDGKPRMALPDSLTSNSEYIFLGESIRQQAGVLDRLCTDEDIQARVIDVFCSADRLRRTEHHVDCVWRCTTTYEIMLRETLRLKHRVNVHPEPFIGYGDIGQMQRRLRGGEPFEVCGYLLQTVALADEGMLRVDGSSLNKTLRSEKAKRNRVVHYAEAIRESKGAVDVIGKAICLFLDVTLEDLRDYPMSVKSLSSVADRVARLLQKHE